MGNSIGQYASQIQSLFGGSGSQQGAGQQNGGYGSPGGVNSARAISAIPRQRRRAADVMAVPCGVASSLWAATGMGLGLAAQVAPQVPRAADV